nr:hypothetical protein [Tanacetum cinerariifolium]
GSRFDLTAFSDADHVGCIDSRKSTSGGIQFLCDKLVSWMSKKQNCIALSSAEAEYVATEYQLADMFTKALPEDMFKYVVRRIVKMEILLEPSSKKLLVDLKELVEYDNYPSKDRPIFLNNDENHSDQNKESLENSSNEIATSSSNQEKEIPSQDSDIHQLIEECSTEVCEEQTQNMEDTMLELVKICQEKEFLCIHDNVDDLIESALNTKLISINSQRLEKEQQEVKNVIEQPAESGNLTPILSTKEPKYSPSMGYEHSNTTPETESDEIVKSGVEELVPILSENEEENVVYQEEEEVDLEDISQIQDVVLREKLLSITRLISNIESLNDNPNPDRVLILSKSDNSLSDNFSPEFETFCDYTEETRCESTTTHANDSLPEYDSFCFEIEPDQERLINVAKNNIFDDSSRDPLLEKVDLFLASDNSIPPGSENVADDPNGDIRFLEELLIDNSILSHESSDSNFKDNPSVP